MICKAIETKYLPATGTKGSRIKAWYKRGKSITVSYDHGLNAAQNHEAAAHELIRRMGDGWLGVWVQGSTKGGYVFVKVS
jgi:hypothetical protein